MASIRVIQGPDKGKTVELIDGENEIGREANIVLLNDDTISRRHARLMPVNGLWALEDSGSANGTFLNGLRINGVKYVKRGDQIRCGSSLLVFEGDRTVIRGMIDVDENGRLVDAAIVATIPSNEDSVIIPTVKAGKEAIGNLRIIYDLISELSSIFNIDSLLAKTLNKAFEVLHADRGYIMLIDDEGELSLKTAKLGSSDTTMEQVPVSRTIINEVIRKQVGVLSSNAMTDKRFASGESVHDFGIRSAICVPMMGREQILGIIQVDCSVSAQTYTTEQLRLLTAIGFQAGLAIENVRLHKSMVEAERLAAVGEAVAVLSHHTKNILQALGGGIDVVEMCLKKGDLSKARQSWPIVQRNIAKINAMILNMLTYSKDREPLRENVNIAHILTDAIELVTPRADERSVAILQALDEIPAIPADMIGLAQAFLNLLTNALDAVDDMTGIVTVSAEYDPVNKAVIVKVSDNGCGIDESLLQNIFLPFYSSKGQKGTGLGLAVTQKIVHEHHGTIEVESSLTGGTTFCLTLPAIILQDPGETSGPARTVEQ